MLISMTGYGAGNTSDEKINVETEIKSLNSRFFELSLKLPKSLQSKEYELREIIRNKIKRGKISLFIQISVNGQSNGANLALNTEKIKEITKSIKQIKKISGIKGSITLDNILNLKEFIISEESNFIEQEFTLAKDALEIAISELNKMKMEEGKAIYDDLYNRINLISEKVAVIEKYAENSVKIYFDSIKEKAKNLLETIGNYNDRLFAELALLSEKYDITEELVRLKSHINLFKETLEDDKEAGKKLNFICQEMNREINTLNNKSLTVDISHNGIYIKEELEKIREQIQNLE